MYEESTDKKLVRLPFNQYDGMVSLKYKSERLK